MRLYLDTEFNGFKGSLISLALVTECGNKEWYEVIEMNDSYNEWVAKHVIPILNKSPLSKKDFRDSLIKFISYFDRPEIISDWHSDIRHFCDILEGDSFKESVSFSGKFIVIQTPQGEPRSNIPHNALSDARALRNWHLMNCSNK